MKPTKHVAWFKEGMQQKHTFFYSLSLVPSGLLGQEGADFLPKGGRSREGRGVMEVCRSRQDSPPGDSHALLSGTCVLHLSGHPSRNS